MLIEGTLPQRRSNSANLHPRCIDHSDLLAIAVWAMNTQESDPTMIGEGGPDWGSEPFEEEQKEYRKAG